MACSGVLLCVGGSNSGARGLADAMTDRVTATYFCTRSFCSIWKKNGVIRPGDTSVASDFRPSTPRIMAAAASAITDLGYQPVNCGNDSHGRKPSIRYGRGVSPA